MQVLPKDLSTVLAFIEFLTGLMCAVQVEFTLMPFHINYVYRDCLQYEFSCAIPRQIYC